MTSQTMALSSNWLDETTFPQSSGGSIGDNTAVGSVTSYGYYYYPEPWHYRLWETKRIDLKLSEVETLRAAAKKDKKLKDILNKFSALIRVEVDF